MGLLTMSTISDTIKIVGYSKEKAKEYMKIYYLEKKQELFEYLGNKCAKCGSTESLEIDHIDWRTKEFTVSKLWSTKDKNRLFLELEKCQLLCTDCHKTKTREDIAEIHTKPPKHGTMYAWMKRGCRCDLCLESQRNWYDKRNSDRRVKNKPPRGIYNRSAEHGTRLLYHRGCMCDNCRSANAQYARELRKK